MNIETLLSNLFNRKNMPDPIDKYSVRRRSYGFGWEKVQTYDFELRLGGTIKQAFRSLHNLYHDCGNCNIENCAVLKTENAIDPKGCKFYCSILQMLDMFNIRESLFYKNGSIAESSHGEKRFYTRIYIPVGEKNILNMDKILAKLEQVKKDFLR